MRREVLTIQLMGGDTGHTLCRQNVHKDPDRPVWVEWSPWFVIQVSALAFVLLLDVVLLLSL